MFTYATKKNRYGDEHIAVSANGAEIATIKPSSYYGKNEYIVSATTGGDDRGDYLGRVSTIAGAKKKIRDWYSEHSAAVTTAAANSRAADPDLCLDEDCVKCCTDFLNAPYDGFDLDPGEQKQK